MSKHFLGKNRDITFDPTEIKKIMKEYYGQRFASQINLDEMNKFVEGEKL